MENRFKARAFYQNRFIYTDIQSSNYCDDENKVIGSLSELPSDLTWEQCTGLIDKNDKVIYEGDIIKLTRARHWIERGTELIVSWDTFSYCGFGFEDAGSLTKKCAENCKIIGNIHEKAVDNTEKENDTK